MTIEERFLIKVNKQSGRFCKIRGTECWEWLAAKDIAGYGYFGLVGKATKAHRASYILFNEDILNKVLLVCHTCDWPSCVNPSHLFLGTSKDNMADKVKKGRAKGQCAGSEHSLSILQDKDIPIIFELNQIGKSNLEIARIYNTDPSNISLLLNGKRWRHVDSPHRGKVKDSRRFTDNEIIEIFKCYNDLKNYTKVSKKFNTVPSVIYNIVKRIKYSHVTVPNGLLIN